MTMNERSSTRDLIVFLCVSSQNLVLDTNFNSCSMLLARPYKINGILDTLPLRMVIIPFINNLILIWYSCGFAQEL